MSEPSHAPAAEPGTSVDPNSVEGLFVAALAKADPDERRAFLDQACGDDLQRRQRVEALLRAYDDSGSFLESPPLAGTEELGFDFLQPSSDPSLLGTLGPYEVIEMIGRGGMGIVFRARDPKLNRVVALKVLAPELAANPNARRRFVREAQAAAAISHPHVVTIHAVDGDAKLPYLVMECIVGQSLQQKLDKQGSLRLTEILRIGKQIAEGLSAAHKQGLIHRDIKPANILLENGVERVKITDFGLARAIDDVSVTRPGEVAGTPQFMSPEQAKGERVDERSDLFCLGCVMYAMCTGRSPFRATSMAAAIRRVCDDSPRPIEEINAELPSWLIETVNQLLEKNPAKRVQSANEVVALLEDRLAEIQASRPMRRRADEPQPSTGEGAYKPGEQSGQEVPRWLLADVSFPFRPSKTTHGIPPRQQTIGSMLTVAGTVLCAGTILLMLLPALMNLPREGYLFDLGVLVAGFTFGLFAVICGTVLRGRPVTSGGMLLILLLLLGPLGLVIWLLRREFYQRQEQLFGQPLQSEQPDQPATASHEDEEKQTDARIGGGRVLALFFLAVVIGVVPSLLVPLDDPDHRIAPGILGVLIGLAMVIADLLERPFGRETRLPPNKILGELRAGQQGAVLLVLSAAYLVPYMLRAMIQGHVFWDTLDDPLPVIALGLIVLAVWYGQFHRELVSAAKRSPRSQLWALLAGAVGLLAFAGVLAWPIVVARLDPEGNLLLETVDQRTVARPAPSDPVGEGSYPTPQAAGAIIVEIANPGLQVRLEPVDQGSGSWGAGSLTEGTHQIPAGKYTPVVVDDRFGWIAGISDVYSESMGEMPGMFAADMMGSMDMGGMGASAGGRYRLPPIDVKPGEFTTLTLRRDLKALAKGHPEWRAGQFYEFLWNGRRYTLSAAQGRVVQQLFAATAAGSPSVAESELLAASTSEAPGEASTFPSTPDPFSSALPAGEKPSPVPESAKPESLTALFNDGKHPAWGELIIEGDEAGAYRLAPVEGE